MWQKRTFQLGQCFQEASPLLGGTRGKVTERRAGRERGSLELTRQHFLLLSVDVCFQWTQVNIQSGNHPSSAYFGQANLTAGRTKKQSTTSGQDTEYITFAHIPLAKHRKSYGQAQSQRAGNRLCSIAGATLSHRAKGKDGEVKEQLGRTIHSTTALYHDTLM